MPEWIHNRAEHLLAKNPDMPKSQAFAVATQQSHALGKSPKGYGTAEGKREAKMKYDTPKGDVKKANPGGLDSPKLAEVDVARLVQRYKKLPAEKLKQVAERIGGAKEKLHKTKIYPLEGKLGPGGMLDMAGGESYRKGKSALEAARSKYDDLNKARRGAAQALSEKSVTAAANLISMRDELMKIALAQLEKDSGFLDAARKLWSKEAPNKLPVKGPQGLLRNREIREEFKRKGISKAPSYQRPDVIDPGFAFAGAPG